MNKDIQIEIEGQLWNLVRRGRAQAEQIHALGKWLYEHGGALIEAISTRGIDEDDLSTGLRMVSTALSKVTADAMLDLYVVLLGCPLEFAEENFDIADLIDVIMQVYKEHPTIKKIVDRFFSDNSSDVGEAENSTTSNAPTDGESET